MPKKLKKRTTKIQRKSEVFRRSNRRLKGFRLCRIQSAVDAIGEIRKGDDITIITFGQFSMIETLSAILRQTGPADVTVASWTAEDYDLERSAYLIEDGSIRSMRFLLDRSWRGRRKALYKKYIERIFGSDGIRGVRNHSKMLLIRSDTHDIVVRGSMNLNTNPNIENVDISEDSELADFMQKIFDSIWSEVDPDEDKSAMPGISGIPEHIIVNEVKSGVIRRDRIREPRTTHVIRRNTRRSDE